MTQDAKLDPQARAVIERAARSGLPGMHTLSASEARRQYRETRLALAGTPLPVDEAREISMTGPAGAIAARFYRPCPAAPSSSTRIAVEGGGAALACVAYFHGGGWTCGDLDTHDAVCRGIASHGGCAVVSIDYRRAPEHRFPAAVEDAIASLRWLAATAASLGIDPERLIVGGDSAGGNLAAVASLALRGEPHAPILQILVYPATDQIADTDSRRRYSQGYLLTAASMEWSRANYLGKDGDAADWRASPLRATDLSGLPPAYIITAGFDPLLDEGRAYAERLEQAGVPVTYECFEGQVHGFLVMGGVMAAAHHAVYRIGQAIRSRVLAL